MKLFKKFLLVIILVLISSCAPQTKESYLVEYQKFIDDISKNHKNYSKKEWKNKDVKFNEFKNKLHNKFKDELTWKDELKLSKNEVTYNLLQLKKETPNILDLFKGDIEGLKKQLKQYTENEMSGDIKQFKIEAEKLKKQLKEYTDNHLAEDVRQLKKGISEMGDEFEKALEKALKEMDVEVDSKK